jgi:hypothetical protein
MKAEVEPSAETSSTSISDIPQTPESNKYINEAQ